MSDSKQEKLEHTKASKSEAGYMNTPKRLWAPEGVGIRCGNCMYFHGGSCGLVQGEIHAQDCCNLFDIEDLGVHPWKFASGSAMETMRAKVISKRR